MIWLYVSLSLFLSLSLSLNLSLSLWMEIHASMEEFLRFVCLRVLSVIDQFTFFPHSDGSVEFEILRH